MMHSAYDVNRILDWVASPRADKPFTRDTVINQLAPISFSLVEYILDREVERGSIYKSGPTGKYYMRKDSNMMSDTEKRLSDLEIKYKWLESVVAEMHMKNNQVLGTQKPLTPKKERLWSATAPIPREAEYIEVMYTDGRIVHYIGKMPLMGSDVLAWREGK
jgi:hypothetical protein